MKAKPDLGTISQKSRLRNTVDAGEALAGKRPAKEVRQVEPNLKLREGQRSHGLLIDFKAVENLLLEQGAKGPVLAPEPNFRPRVW